MEPVLEVSGVSKRFANRLRYALRYGLANIVRACFGKALSGDLRPGEFWALDQISFTLGRGEALAILGSNGSGKSTLLKLIYGILKPDRGKVVRRGRCYGLMELGVGLESRLSGRENIALWASMQQSDAAARRRISEAAAAFSELAEDLDKPVQSYSSGMKARLSFAMAASADADLLLIDEALAVGDTPFQIKCMHFLADYIAAGGALLLTSHTDAFLDRLGTRALLLASGRATAWDDVAGALAALERNTIADRKPQVPATTAGVRVVRIEASGPGGGPLHSGDPLEVRISYVCDGPLTVGWYFLIHTASGGVCIMGDRCPEDVTLRPGMGQLSCRLPSLPLLPGEYCLEAGIMDQVMAVALCQIGADREVRLQVLESRDLGSHGPRKRVLGQLVRIEAESWRAD